MIADSSSALGLDAGPSGVEVTPTASADGSVTTVAIGYVVRRVRGVSVDGMIDPGLAPLPRRQCPRPPQAHPTTPPPVHPAPRRGKIPYDDDPIILLIRPFRSASSTVVTSTAASATQSGAAMGLMTPRSGLLAGLVAVVLAL